MEKETEIILLALRDFSKSDELKGIKKPITFPNISNVPKEWRGKTVNVPMFVTVNWLLKTKVNPKKLIKMLDPFSDVIGIFLKYLKPYIEDYEYENRMSEEELKKLVSDKYEATKGKKRGRGR